jgi:hypothetical protein
MPKVVGGTTTADGCGTSCTGGRFGTKAVAWDVESTLVLVDVVGSAAAFEDSWRGIRLRSTGNAPLGPIGEVDGTTWGTCRSEQAGTFF